MRDRELVIVRAISSASLICSTALALVLAIKAVDIVWAAAFVGLVTVTVGSRFLATRLYQKEKSIDWLLSVAILNFVLIAELALRVIDFAYVSKIEFGYPRPVGASDYRAHEKLFWIQTTSTPGVNSLGFRGNEIPVPKPAGVYRILFLGDSVTAEGYPIVVERVLNETYADAGQAFESAELAVHGYSSHQGVALCEMYGTVLEPDLAVVHFGWNDHWQAYGTIDSEKTVRVSDTAAERLGDWVYRRSRILQYVSWLGHSLSGANLPIGEVRVPVEQYRDNLDQMVSFFAAQDVPILLITAPTLHYRLGVPDYLVELRFVEDKASAVSLHKQYNQVVRDFGREEGVPVLDLEAEMERLSDEELKAAFTEDGVHFTAQGKELVGALISDYVSLEKNKQ